jgi:peptide deformylase
MCFAIMIRHFQDHIELKALYLQQLNEKQDENLSKQYNTISPYEK